MFGTKGKRRSLPLQPDIVETRVMVEGDAAEARFGMAGGGGGVVEGANAHPLLPQPLEVDIGDDQLGGQLETSRCRRAIRPSS